MCNLNMVSSPLWKFRAKYKKKKRKTADTQNHNFGKIINEYEKSLNLNGWIYFIMELTYYCE